MKDDDDTTQTANPLWESNPQPTRLAGGIVKITNVGYVKGGVSLIFMSLYQRAYRRAVMLLYSVMSTKNTVCYWRHLRLSL